MMNLLATILCIRQVAASFGGETPGFSRFDDFLQLRMQNHPAQRESPQHLPAEAEEAPGFSRFGDFLQLRMQNHQAQLQHHGTQPKSARGTQHLPAEAEEAPGFSEFDDFLQLRMQHHPAQPESTRGSQHLPGETESAPGLSSFDEWQQNRQENYVRSREEALQNEHRKIGGLLFELFQEHSESNEKVELSEFESGKTERIEPIGTSDAHSDEDLKHPPMRQSTSFLTRSTEASGSVSDTESSSTSSSSSSDSGETSDSDFNFFDSASGSEYSYSQNRKSRRDIPHDDVVDLNDFRDARIIWIGCSPFIRARDLRQADMIRSEIRRSRKRSSYASR